MALALLYLTVLSFSGQMVAYLLSTGFTSSQIGIMRTISVALEMSATWLAPLAINSVGPVRAGLWSISWQTVAIIGAVSFFWVAQNPFIAAGCLVAGVAISRIGLWGFDLSVQMLVQEVRSHSIYSNERLSLYRARESKPKHEDASHPWRPRSRTSSSCAPTRLLSSLLALSNLGIRC